jgi:hypothetical protein
MVTTSEQGCTTAGTGDGWRMDPLAGEYPSMSVYNFTGNNPIYYMDPDGRIIRVYISEGKFYDYTPGIAPQNIYSVQHKIHQAIEYNMNTEIGTEIWKSLHEAGEVIVIRATRGESRFDAEIFGETSADGKTTIGTIYWNPQEPIGFYTQDGVDDDWGGLSNVKGYISPSTVLLHEGGHAQEALRVLSTNDKDQIANWKASNMEHNDFGYDYPYDTKEERRNIIDVEQKYIKQINKWELQNNSDAPQLQPLRYNHSGHRSYHVLKNPNDVYKPNLYKQWKSARESEDAIIDDGL